MLRGNSLRRMQPLTQHKETSKVPQMRREVGSWLHNADTMKLFQTFCRAEHVRAYGNIRITSSVHYARCLRAKKKLYPGQGIITLPLSTTYSFLDVARNMFDVTNNFPLQISWMNYNERVPYLPGSSYSELVTAGWLCRIASTEEGGPSPYIQWLLEDTRGRDGIASGIGKERGEESSMLDHILSEMATDAGEEPDAFLENLFRSFACILMRSVPLETDAIEYKMAGTNFFQSRAHQMFVPALMPLIDCVPQREDGLHNCMVDFVREEDLTHEKRITLSKELELPDLDAPSNKGGLLVLRSMTAIDEGEYLSLRGWPKTGTADQETISSNVMESARLLNNTDVGI